jgi:hypothetical protein
LPQGHQLQRRRLTFTALDNGFLRAADPVPLQAVCDQLSAADIEAFTRWLARAPLPLAAPATRRVSAIGRVVAGR